MNCGRFEKLIDAYLDSQLSGTLLAEFHAHRLNCRRCSRIVSMLQAAGDVIAQDRGEPKISADFADRVLAAMPVAPKVNRSVWLVRLGAGAAGLAAAAAIVLAVFVSSQVPARRIAGGVAWAPDSGVASPEHSRNIVIQSSPTAEASQEASSDSTILDGKVVRDAVKHMDWWYEANRTGE